MTLDLTMLYPVMSTVLLAMLTYAGQKLAAYLDERKLASQVSRVAMAISTVSGNVLNEMLLHPGAPADTLRQVQQQAIRQGVAYVQTRLPDTLKALGGVDPRTIEAMIAGAIGNRAGAAVLGGEVIAPKGAIAGTAADGGLGAASAAPVASGAVGAMPPAPSRVRVIEPGQEPTPALAGTRRRWRISASTPTTGRIAPASAAHGTPPYSARPGLVRSKR